MIKEDEDAKTCSAGDSSNTKVHFIDYEYVSPCPPAFDLANHFSEWGGLDFDYNMLPTQATRRAFIEEYLRSFANYRPNKDVMQTEVEELMTEVDRFRGLPGFYWGIWALVQATISYIDFDCTAYSKVRLAEFWAWREEEDGIRSKSGVEMPVREKMWAQES
jgi:ethanolamine kinase